MVINKKTMEQETYQILKTLFQLKEIHKVAIKDIVIQSIEDHEHILQGLNECYHDNLSDVDINVWIRIHPLDYNKTTPVYRHFLSRLRFQNQIFGIAYVERNTQLNNKEGMRVCFDNGYRMDFTCFVECDETAEPLTNYITVENKEFIQREDSSDIIDLDASNRFWFISIQALAKLLRHDYLIADHLSHMMLMEGLVLQMLERDRQYGTNFHRYGYSESLMYQQVPLEEYGQFIHNQDETYQHIASNLCKAVLSYDKLALQYSGSYRSHIKTFFEIWDCYIS